MPDLNDEPIRFLAEDPKQAAVKSDPWVILVVDDEDDVHRTTSLVLRDFKFEGRALRFLDAYSGAEAREILSGPIKAAVVFVDVVMESDDAGLKLVEWIRTGLGDKLVRLVLRTGQPGAAPERSVIERYDINDYKDKTELTAVRLWTTLTVALRGYRDLLALRRGKDGLRKIIDASAGFYGCHSVRSFFDGVLQEIAALVDLGDSALYSRASGFALARTAEDFVVLSGTGDYSGLIGRPLAKVEDHVLLSEIQQAISSGAPRFFEDRFVGYFRGEDEAESVIVFDCLRSIPEEVRELINVFSANVSIAFSNVTLTESLEAKIRERSERLATSEKMAALGLVAASVAHEINNPLAAVVSANRSLQDLMSRLPGPVGRALAGLPEDALSELEALATDVPRSVPEGSERRALRRALTAALKESPVASGLQDADLADAVENAVEIGGKLVREDELSALLAKPYGMAMLSVAAELVASRRNCDLVEEAAGRAERFVSALRTYARTGEEPPSRRTNVQVSAGLEIALTLFSHQIKRDIEVVRRYGDVPDVIADEDSLLRVWMNLISNAIHAMQYRGRLELSVEAEGPWVRVDVVDDGSGVSPELGKRIFEPFVTSKQKGEGTGLGLDIVKRTVEAHGGTIDFESRPGRTDFAVRLPAARQVP